MGNSSDAMLMYFFFSWKFTNLQISWQYFGAKTDHCMHLQGVAYLLISALSAAVPITNRMRSAVVNTFTDATDAAISMAFFAFVALALSAVVSGYKLSKQTA
jgi:hypothetical protein